MTHPCLRSADALSLSRRGIASLPTATATKRHLALSTNSIAAIQNLAGLENLKVLSLGRNQIKKFDNIEAVSSTLEEIWISYNLIESLSGLDKAKGLKKLYMSNNLIAKWSEIEKLQANPELERCSSWGIPSWMRITPRTGFR